MVLIRLLIDEAESVDRLELCLIFGGCCRWEKVQEAHEAREE